MIESFVDLTYRGLSVGRRVKLGRVRPTSGYLEIPTPMPVGTAITIVTDEGLVIDAVVHGIHEQVGGSDKTPGMQVVPALAVTAEIAAWWAARVALPDEEPVVAPTPMAKPVVKPLEAAKVQRITMPGVAAEVPAAAAQVEEVSAAVSSATPVVIELDASSPMALRDEDVMTAAAAMAAIPAGSHPLTLRPRPRTIESLPPDEMETTESGPAPVRVSDEHSVPELVDDGKRTVVMDSVDPALIEQLMRPSSDSIPVVDDKPTMIMAALDPAALGLDVGRGSSDDIPTHDPDASDGEADDDGKPKPSGSSTVRRRRAQKKR